MYLIIRFLNDRYELYAHVYMKHFELFEFNETTSSVSTLKITLNIVSLHFVMARKNNIQKKRMIM